MPRVRGFVLSFLIPLAVVFLATPEIGGALQGSTDQPDPILRLQEQLDRGEVELEFSPGRGYLDSLLEALDIPSSSQTLVFSKTSLQADAINPDNPRALYFNDDVYIGWVNGGPIIEIAAVDPEQGTVFYTLPQEETTAPTFEQEGMRCISCHLPSRPNTPVPRLMVMSILPNTNGGAVGTEVLLITDESSMNQRWGGWYVTATDAGGMHRGNMVIDNDRGKGWGIGEALNVTDLSGRFDTSSYLRGSSDIVALMLLVHQSHIHNLIGDAAYAVRAAIEEERERNPARREAGTGHSERTLDRVEEFSEPLLEALLFAGAPPFRAPIRGNTTFVEDFQAAGIRDDEGRSLRDLDLGTRLLRYPLSYLIYSEPFDQLPDLVLDYLGGRLSEILSGEDASPDFAHLTAADRTAILEILQDTKPDFARRIAQQSTRLTGE